MRPEILRKLIHMLFSIIMYLPIYIAHIINVNPVQFYGFIIAFATWVYALKVKGPPPGINIDEIMRKVRDTSEQFKIIEKAISSIEQVISDVEREYEKRAGWIGLLAGAIGISVSYILFNDIFVIGVLALAVLDGIAAIAGITLGKIRIPYSHGTVEGTIAGALSYFLVLLFFMKPVSALMTTLTATIAELYGVEDNITVPISATAMYFALLTLKISI
ncbi:MAG: hypothetical protein ACP5IZ_09225 [Thermoprotei archaeon]